MPSYVSVSQYLKSLAVLTAMLALTGCGGELPAPKTAGAIETAPQMASAPSAAATAAADQTPDAGATAAQLAADRAYADLQTALSGPPLYKGDVAPYNQGVTEAYNRWTAAEVAAYGPDWQQKYVAQQTALQQSACQAKAAADTCHQNTPSAPVTVPSLQSLLVVDDGRFHDYVDPAQASSAATASSASEDTASAA